MATPIGHAFAACGIWLGGGSREAGRTWALAVCAVFAVAPDFDFLPGLLVGEPGRYHHGISHSVGILVPAALLGAWVFTGVAAGFLRRAILIGLSYGSHLVLDMLGPDNRPPIGIPVLWPLSDAPYLAPWTPLMGVSHSPEPVTGTALWLETVFSLRNLAAVGLELAVVAPFVLAMLLCARSRRG